MENFDAIYNKVLELVKNKVTIEQACKKINIHKHQFYYSMNEEQKKELKSFKLASSTFTKSKNIRALLDVHSFFTDEDKVFD